MVMDCGGLLYDPVHLSTGLKFSIIIKKYLLIYLLAELILVVACRIFKLHYANSDT